VAGGGERTLLAVISCLFQGKSSRLVEWKLLSELEKGSLTKRIVCE